MRKSSVLSIVFVVAGLWLAGCRSVSEPASGFLSSARPALAPRPAAADLAFPATPEPGSPGYNPVNDPMITLSAQLELGTGDVGKLQLELMSLAKRHNGYMLTSTPEETAIRVEQSKFMEATAEAETLGQLLDKRIYGESKEAEFQAAAESLQALEETRTRLLGELAKADNPKERQALESQLQGIERQLLAARQSQGGLKRTVHYATITVAHHKKQTMGPVTAVFWGGARVFRWLFVID